MHEIIEPVAFLVLGREESLFCDVKDLLGQPYMQENNCILNLCCDSKKIDFFIQKLNENIVKVANNCVIIDGLLPEQQLKDLVTALKANQAFLSLPIIVLADIHNTSLINYLYRQHVSAVVAQPLQQIAFTGTFKVILNYWISIAKLPPYAIIRENNIF